MMPAPWLSLVPWRAIGIAAAAGAAVLYFGHVQRDIGRAEIRTEWAAEKQAAADAAIKKATEDIENADKRAIEFQAKVQEAVAQREPVIKYVNRYVAQDPTATRSDLSDSWVRGHDGAALNIDPAALVSGVIDGTAGRPTNGSVLQTVDRNYSIAHQWRSKLHYARVELAQCQGKSADWIKQNLPAP